MPPGGAAFESQRLPLDCIRGAVCASRRLRIKAANLLLHFACVRRGGQGRPPLQTLRRGFSPPSRLRRQPLLAEGAFSKKSSPERIAFRAGSGEKRLFRPVAPSSFLNLKSSENCLIEREGAFAPFTLSPLLCCGTVFYGFDSVQPGTHCVPGCTVHSFIPYHQVPKGSWLSPEEPVLPVSPVLPESGSSDRWCHPGFRVFRFLGFGFDVGRDLVGDVAGPYRRPCAVFPLSARCRRP